MRGAALALLLAVASTSCGGGGGDGEAAGSRRTTTSAGRVTTTTDPSATPADESSPTTAGASGPGTPTTVAGGTAAGNGGRIARPPEFEAQLARECLHAGDEQTLTVTDAAADRPVLYSSKYSDGSTVLSDGYDTGDGNGTTDADGGFQTTWIVPPTAPSGQATLTVAVWADYDENPQARQLPFTIKPAGQAC